jgi:hypothetical protein
MRKIKLLASIFTLCLVALVYVASYAQTTTSTGASANDNKSTCCAMAENKADGESCRANCSCCADGVCKDKTDKKTSHAEEMKGKGERCKIKQDKAKAQSVDEKSKESCCGCCAGCADGVCKDKKEGSMQSGEKGLSCCNGGSCCSGDVCCMKRKAA